MVLTRKSELVISNMLNVISYHFLTLIYKNENRCVIYFQSDSMYSR